MTLKELSKAPPDDGDVELWGRQVDIAGTEYFSVVVDPMDAKEACDGGIAEMMAMSPAILAELLFRGAEEEQWFTPLHVLWGLSIADYDDDEPVIGVRCTMVGYN